MTAERCREYVKLLKSELSPALGCTEPAAAALVSAFAAEAGRNDGSAGRIPDRIVLSVSRYIFKNGMNVGIPGIGERGLPIAAALGAVGGRPEKGLMVLSGLDGESRKLAGRMVCEGRVEIRLAETEKKVYLEAEAFFPEGSARAVIEDSHENLVRLEKNGKVLFRREPDAPGRQEEPLPPETLALPAVYDFVTSVDERELDFLQQVIDVNTSIAREGLLHDYGLQVGKNMLSRRGNALLSDGIVSYAAACAAAAADARMAGCEKPVMSAAGSGNQGLTATVPIAVIGEKLHCSGAEVKKALAFSLCMTIHAKQYLGRLSVLCGCSLAAAVGVCCGTVFLLKGNCGDAARGIQTMAADISGVICDGAKPGCALKIATAVNSALRAAVMALNGIGAGEQDGIVAGDAEDTLKNLGKLGSEGMPGTNEAILEMMLHKKHIPN